jgi:trehalose 6-phosphate synthase
MFTLPSTYQSKSDIPGIGRGDVPGDPQVLQGIIDDFTYLRDTAWAVSQELDAVVALASSGGFEGEVAEALRGVVSGQLKTFVSNIARAFSLAAEAAIEYRLVLVRAQQAAAKVVSQAAGPAAGDAKLAGLKGQVQGQLDQVNAAAQAMEAALRDAADMVSQPIKVPSLWGRIRGELEQVLSITGGVLALASAIVDGPVGLTLAAAAFGAGASSLEMTAVDYTKHRAKWWMVALAVVGVLAPGAPGMVSMGALGAGARAALEGAGLTAVKTAQVLSSPMKFAKFAARGMADLSRVAVRGPEWSLSAVRRGVVALPDVPARAAGSFRGGWQSASVAVERDFARVVKWHPSLVAGVGAHTAYVLVNAGRLAGALFTPLRFGSMARFGFRGAWAELRTAADWGKGLSDFRAGWEGAGVRAARVGGGTLGLPHATQFRRSTLPVLGPVKETKDTAGAVGELGEPLLAPVAYGMSADRMLEVMRKLEEGDLEKLFVRASGILQPFLGAVPVVGRDAVSVGLRAEQRESLVRVAYALHTGGEQAAREVARSLAGEGRSLPLQGLAGGGGLWPGETSGTKSGHIGEVWAGEAPQWEVRAGEVPQWEAPQWEVREARAEDEGDAALVPRPEAGWQKPHGAAAAAPAALSGLDGGQATEVMRLGSVGEPISERSAVAQFGEVPHGTPQLEGTRVWLVHEPGQQPHLEAVDAHGVSLVGRTGTPHDSGGGFQAAGGPEGVLHFSAGDEFRYRTLPLQGGEWALRFDSPLGSEGRVQVVAKEAAGPAAAEGVAFARDSLGRPAARVPVVDAAGVEHVQTWRLSSAGVVRDVPLKGESLGALSGLSLRERFSSDGWLVGRSVVGGLGRGALFEHLPATSPELADRLGPGGFTIRERATGNFVRFNSFGQAALPHEPLSVGLFRDVPLSAPGLDGLRLRVVEGTGADGRFRSSPYSQLIDSTGGAVLGYRVLLPREDEGVTITTTGGERRWNFDSDMRLETVDTRLPQREEFIRIDHATGGEPVVMGRDSLPAADGFTVRTVRNSSGELSEVTVRLSDVAAEKRSVMWRLDAAGALREAEPPLTEEGISAAADLSSRAPYAKSGAIAAETPHAPHTPPLEIQPGRVDLVRTEPDSATAGASTSLAHTLVVSDLDRTLTHSAHALRPAMPDEHVPQPLGVEAYQAQPPSHMTETTAGPPRRLPASADYPDHRATTPPARVLLASNRGPVSFSRSKDGTLTTKRGSGGLVSGLSAIGPEAGAVWVCATLSDADREATRGGTYLDHEVTGGQHVRMLDIDAATFADAYNGIANSTLWFVHHLLYDTPPVFDQGFRSQWTSYNAYNTAFADALAKEAAQGAKVVVQDYHLTLTPQLLRERRPDLRIGHFSHTPWAPPDYYRLLPDDIAAQVLRGILGADRAAFLTHRWADAFADCCAEVLGAEVRPAGGELTVTHEGRTTRIGVHGLGVDAGSLRERSHRPDVAERLADLRRQTGESRKLIVRVDRTDLSKNIILGLAAYQRLLETHPEWHGRVVHFALAVPSRHDLVLYRNYTRAVQRLADQINSKFERDDWKPLILHVKEDFAGALAAYRLADVALVNPIRDGMNLVAKEIPVVSEKGCAMVLSREAGAFAELGDHAIAIDPFDVEETARALHEALTMNPAERAARTERLAAAAALSPKQWFLDQLEAL